MLLDNQNSREEMDIQCGQMERPRSSKPSLEDTYKLPSAPPINPHAFAHFRLSFPPIHCP